MLHILHSAVILPNLFVCSDNFLHGCTYIPPNVVYKHIVSIWQHKMIPLALKICSPDPINPSSHGNKFLIAYMRNAIPRNPGDSPEAYFVVSTKDNGTVAFEMNTRFGGVENTTIFTVTRDQPTRVAFNPDTVYVLSRADRDKAIWIQAEGGKKISVYVVNDESRSTDAFVALPCDAMKVPGDYIADTNISFYLLSTISQVRLRPPKGLASFL